MQGLLTSSVCSEKSIQGFRVVIHLNAMDQLICSLLLDFNQMSVLEDPGRGKRYTSCRMGTDHPILLFTVELRVRIKIY